MSSLWDCEKCGYNHYGSADKCKNCGTESNLPDMVNHPPHYKDASGIECIEVTKHMQFCGGNCFKYLYRAGKKGSTVEDLKKAAWYAKAAEDSDGVINNDEWTANLQKVAQHRSELVKAAMLSICLGYWYTAGLYIQSEIARLESE